MAVRFLRAFWDRSILTVIDNERPSYDFKLNSVLNDAVCDATEALS